MISKLSKPIQNMSFISQPDLDNTKENKRYEIISLNYFGKKNNSNIKTTPLFGRLLDVFF